MIPALSPDVGDPLLDCAPAKSWGVGTAELVIHTCTLFALLVDQLMLLVHVDWPAAILHGFGSAEIEPCGGMGVLIIVSVIGGLSTSFPDTGSLPKTVTVVDVPPLGILIMVIVPVALDPVVSAWTERNPTKRYPTRKTADTKTKHPTNRIVFLVIVLFIHYTILSVHKTIWVCTR